MITIVNYGMGNLGSVLNMCKRIGVAAQISSDINVIEKAEKLLLPGVGAFGAAMQLINDGGLLEVLNYKAKQEKVPILGICLGMQLLTNSSEEGHVKGLGWINAETIKFQFENNVLKIPHMGWNFIKPRQQNLMLENLNAESKFYFVHSYFVRCNDDKNILANTHYGNDFNSIIHHENIYGAQFHPEKSHKFGMQLLTNFSKI
jgi:imidazole glycerol-phosphate synthase subunit HisH